MINSYFTLKSILRENVENFGVLREIFTRERNQLIITSDPDGEGGKSLVISCEPRQNYLYFCDAVRRGRKKSYDLLPSAAGKTVKDIELHECDREINISLNDDLALVIQLFGARANVMVIDSDNIVLDSFLRPAELKGKPAPLPNINPPLPLHYDNFKSALLERKETDIEKSLKSVLIIFGSILVREILARSNVDGQFKPDDIGEKEFGELWSAFVEIREELDNPSPRIYYEDDNPVEFGLIKLRQYDGYKETLYRHCSEGIRFFIGTVHKQQRIDNEKKELLTRLSNELKKTERAHSAIGKELEGPDQAKTYEKYGQILIINPDAKTKGEQVIELQDPDEGGRNVQIAVDPRYNAIRNAEIYYNKARKRRHKRIESVRRFEETEKRLHNLRNLIEEFKMIEETKMLKKFINEKRELLSEAGIRLKSGKKEEIPFRVFKVFGDFEVWVGKSGKNNDLLTMKYAKPNDLWFHARGASGSHVVLKKSGRTDIPKEAVERAASIAAYYSKMKTSKLVPVTTTERKYVRKRKGDPPGTVIVSREKVLMVEPKLPK